MCLKGWPWADFCFANKYHRYLKYPYTYCCLLEIRFITLFCLNSFICNKFHSSWQHLIVLWQLLISVCPYAEAVNKCVICHCCCLMCTNICNCRHCMSMEIMKNKTTEAIKNRKQIIRIRMRMRRICLVVYFPSVGFVHIFKFFIGNWLNGQHVLFYTWNHHSVYSCGQCNRVDLTNRERW